MSLFLFKSILSFIFLLAGLIATLCMLTLMGKVDRKISVVLLRKVHEASGFVFFMMLLLISYFCIKYVAMVGDQLSPRAVMHGVLALGLFIVFILKILVVRFFKQFLKYAPVMGMIVFSFAFVVTATSGGYYFLRAMLPNPEPTETMADSQVQVQGNPNEGEALFTTKCGPCHYPDREEKKLGPGFKNLLKKEKLPQSGRLATIENVKKQLFRPFLIMPAFANLSEQELADLLAYLKTL